MNKKPMGILPYDFKFQAGYHKDGFSKREEGFSIFPRTNKLRKEFLDGEFRIDAQRALLLTEAYKMYADDPIIIKRAKALNHILSNIDVYIYEDELVAGTFGAPNKHANVYPEFSYGWIVDEMDNFPFEDREFDNYLISEETKEQLRSIADFWKGKTLEETISSKLSFDEQKGSNLGIGMYLLNLYHVGGIGHLVLNYDRLLEIGYGGYKKLLEERLATCETEDEKNTIKALIIAVEGAITYIRRYAEAYEAKAATETDARLKSEYEIIAKNLKNVSTKPASNFWEAVQLTHMATMITHVESNGHSISTGRMDQYLYPYYEKSLESGEFTQEFMQEILESLFIKLGTPSKLRDKMTAVVNTGRTFGGESLTIGGVDIYGNDATTDLTFMVLDASAHTRMMVPWVCVRMHENTPKELKRKVVEVIKAGYGHPKVYNDQVAIPSHVRGGKTLEDARNYAVVGCVEPTIPGKESGWHDAAYMNIARIFEVAVNDGRCFQCGEHCPRYSICAGDGKKLGLSTGSLETFKSIEEVKTAFEKQSEYFINHMVNCINIMDDVHREMAPTPFTSIHFDNCITTAKDMSAGGCEYNNSGPQGSGIGTIADSMTAIDQLVFEQKICTGKELLDAVKMNWEGSNLNEKLYSLVNSSKIPHYGNDDDYADAFAAWAFDTYCANVETKKNRRGGKFQPGVYGVSANVAFGLISGSSIDGRKIGEPISDNMGPVHNALGSHDTEGPTAIVNSVTKINHGRASNGTLLNWKFNPTNVAGETGSENLMNIIDTYFEKKGMHSQFIIMSTDTMKAAMETPDKYKDMLVRVAGYSAYFVELSKPLQLDLIGRTELSFE